MCAGVMVRKDARVIHENFAYGQSQRNNHHEHATPGAASRRAAALAQSTRVLALLKRRRCSVAASPLSDRELLSDDMK